MRSPSKERTVVCPCGAPFTTRHSQGRYCSETCARGGARRSWREYSSRHRSERRRYGRGHYLSNREAVLERTRAYQQTPAGRAAQRRNDQHQREKFPEKYAARQAVLVALRTGKLTRGPCRCGALRTEAHHRDYTKPFEVEWLCRRCHDLEGGRAADRSAA